MDASASVGQGFFTVPCNRIPTVGFFLGNQLFNVSPSIFNLGVFAGNQCIGGVISDDKIRELAFPPCKNQIETVPCLAFWVLGDVFLRVSKLFFTFDGLRDCTCTEFLHRFRPSKRSCWLRYSHMSFQNISCDGIVSKQTNKPDSCLNKFAQPQSFPEDVHGCSYRRQERIFIHYIRRTQTLVGTRIYIFKP
jgi:hypothetical protein